MDNAKYKILKEIPNSIPAGLPEIIEEWKTIMLPIPGRVGVHDVNIDYALKPDIRDSSVRFIREKHQTEAHNIINKWIADQGFPELKAQVLQISEYKVGQYYHWHTDSYGERKLSLTALLNDDFEGGQFEVEGMGEVFLKKGDMVLFSSGMKHRVRRVTKGVRESLVVWFVEK